MIVCLDTNVWVFGLFGKDFYCEGILLILPKFHILLPNQIRAEIERNLPGRHMKIFYALASEAGVQFDFDQIPGIFLDTYGRRGLKKGDQVIGAFCEWRQVDILVSDNRDFLRSLSGKNHFQVMSPKKFMEATQP